MIDTIVLKLKYPSFQVTNPEFFMPVLKISRTEDVPANQRKHEKVYTKYIQNESKDDKAEGIRKPNLTIVRSFRDGELIYELHIQMSIPKMLYGHNLNIVDDYQFGTVINTLTQKLKTMGVDVAEDVLEDAEVIRVHCGKNIILPHPRTVAEAINELAKAELGKSMDVDTRDYKNGGEALYFYCGSRNFIFYDKVKDITKPKVKATEKYKTHTERDIAESGALKDLELLRFEVRLNSAKIIYSQVRKIITDCPEKLTFGDLLNKDLCKKILIKSWEEILKRPANQLAFKSDFSDEEAFQAFITRERKDATGSHSLNRVLHSFGLYALIKTLGIQGVKDRLGKVWSNTSCGKRLEPKIKRAAVTLAEIPLNNLIAFIDQELREEKDKIFNF